MLDWIKALLGQGEPSERDASDKSIGELVSDLDHPFWRYHAIRELGNRDDPRGDAAILEALVSDDPSMLALAATSAGQRGLESARERLAELLGWSPPSTPHNPDYQPESWEEDRIDAMRDEANEERVRQAAREALAKIAIQAG